MKTKKIYISPDIDTILLDNQISLQLQSDNSAPEDPINWL